MYDVIMPAVTIQPSTFSIATDRIILTCRILSSIKLYQKKLNLHILVILSYFIVASILDSLFNSIDLIIICLLNVSL